MFQLAASNATQSVIIGKLIQFGRRATTTPSAKMLREADICRILTPGLIGPTA